VERPDPAPPAGNGRGTALGRPGGPLGRPGEPSLREGSARARDLDPGRGTRLGAARRSGPGAGWPRRPYSGAGPGWAGGGGNDRPRDRHRAGWLQAQAPGGESWAANKTAKMQAQDGRVPGLGWADGRAFRSGWRAAAIAPATAWDGRVRPPPGCCYADLAPIVDPALPRISWGCWPRHAQGGGPGPPRWARTPRPGGLTGLPPPCDASPVGRGDGPRAGMPRLEVARSSWRPQNKGGPWPAEYHIRATGLELASDVGAARGWPGFRTTTRAVTSTKASCKQGRASWGMYPGRADPCGAMAGRTATTLRGAVRQLNRPVGGMGIRLPGTVRETWAGGLHLAGTHRGQR